MSKVNKILIVMCGMPGSGKTTSCEELIRHFRDKFNVGATYINRDSISAHMGYDRLNLYPDQSRKVLAEALTRLDRWVLNYDSRPICLWDNTDINYFKRKVILDKLDAFRDEDPKNDNFIICAIHMNRSIMFCKEHNRSRKYVIPDASMQRFYRNQQQPVYEEGFDIVFHVDGNKRLAIDPFIHKISQFVDLERLKNNKIESARYENKR